MRSKAWIDVNEVFGKTSILLDLPTGIQCKRDGAIGFSLRIDENEDFDDPHEIQVMLSKTDWGWRVEVIPVDCAMEADAVWFPSEGE